MTPEQALKVTGRALRCKSLADVDVDQLTAGVDDTRALVESVLAYSTSVAGFVASLWAVVASLER